MYPAKRFWPNTSFYDSLLFAERCFLVVGSFYFSNWGEFSIIRFYFLLFYDGRIDESTLSCAAAILLAKKEIPVYNKYRQSTHSKVDAPETGVTSLSLSAAHPVGRRGGHFFNLAYLVDRERQAV